MSIVSHIGAEPGGLGGLEPPLESKVPHRANTKIWSEPPSETLSWAIFTKVRRLWSHTIQIVTMTTICVRLYSRGIRGAFMETK